jgi:UDP-N-acetylmuramate dehydrogenase
MSFREELLRITDGRARTEEPLDRHNTFRIGGPAQYYVAPRSVEEAARVLQLAHAHNVPVRILGNGSNLLIPDAGVRGLVLHITRPIGEIELRDNDIHVGAGVPLIQLMQFSARNGLTGLEWACGIPGTVGGALLTNAGTPAGQMGDTTVEIDIVEPDGTIHTLSQEEFAFAYRQSSLRGSGRIAVGCTVSLQPGDPEEILQTIKTYNQRRLLTQPVGTRNSGCIFKNPPDHRVGQAVDQAGLKGRRVGHASISTVHGNFIINEGGARASDVLELIATIKDSLRSELGVELQEEVEIWS